MSREGGCQCGHVRYRIDAEPTALAVCHCTDCQQQSGSAFGMTLVVPADGFTITRGELESFVKVADSGNRGHCFFCPKCGGRIYNAPELLKESVNVKPGTLDDRGFLAPIVHVWTASKQPWVEIPDGVPSFRRNPPLRSEPAK